MYWACFFQAIRRFRFDLNKEGCLRLKLMKTTFLMKWDMFLIPHSFSAIPVGEGQEGVSL